MKQILPEVLTGLNLDLDMLLYLQKINNNKYFIKNSETEKILRKKMSEEIKKVFGIRDPEDDESEALQTLKQKKDELMIKTMIKREQREERREQREIKREAREVARFNDYQANMVAKALEKKFAIQEQERKLKNKIDCKQETDEEYINRRKQEIQNEKGINRGRFEPIRQRYEQGHEYNNQKYGETQYKELPDPDSYRAETKKILSEHQQKLSRIVDRLNQVKKELEKNYAFKKLQFQMNNEMTTKKILDYDEELLNKFLKYIAQYYADKDPLVKEFIQLSKEKDSLPKDPVADRRMMQDMIDENYIYPKYRGQQRHRKRGKNKFYKRW